MRDHDLAFIERSDNGGRENIMINIQVSAETTPNPQTLKFNVHTQILERGSIDLASGAEAGKSPLAKALFDIPGVSAIHIGTQFVTVTKKETAQWPDMAQTCVETLKKVFAEEAEVLGDLKPSASAIPQNDPISRQIMEILDNEIRPAVAQDGGDIVFHGFKDGVVTLHLQGSCSSCPSSVLTLKMGVENRLKSMIPEIKEVVQLQ
jgi:Fe-S cluster biogenesis protein NfuA